MSTSEAAIFTITFLSENLAKGVLSAVGKDVWTFLTDSFSTEKEKKALADLKENPTDSILQGKAINRLEDLLDENPDYLNQLERILANVPNAQKVNRQSIKGNGNIAMQDATNSQINVNSAQHDK